MVSINTFNIGNYVININNQKIGIINSISYDIYSGNNNHSYFIVYIDKSSGEFLNEEDINHYSISLQEPI